MPEPRPKPKKRPKRSLYSLDAQEGVEILVKDFDEEITDPDALWSMIGATTTRRPASE